jgi:23S rRNA (adenine2503-C2)-methyltransferase
VASLAFTTPIIASTPCTTSRAANPPTLLWGSSAVHEEHSSPRKVVSHVVASTTAAAAVAPPENAVTTTATTPLPANNVGGVGALSMTMEELTPFLGGRIGRAQLVWDCYAIGVDPALYFGNAVDGMVSPLGSNNSIMHGSMHFYDEEEDYESIRQAMPSTRRQTRLGRDALQKLAQTYCASNVNNNTATNTSNNNGIDNNWRVEDGVASLVHVSRSADGTTKLLLQMRDGLQVETVIIPIDKKKKKSSSRKMSAAAADKDKNSEDERNDTSSTRRASTVCLSSQVGCRQACTFCATGRMGIQRSLTSDEILAQYYFATKLSRLYHDLPRINNVVFMGMGDAADNAVAVTRAVHILTRQFQLAAQKVTVSTVGPTPHAFMDLTRTATTATTSAYDAATAPCVLAWSVHAARDEIRQRLVPTMKSRGYTIAELRNGLIRALLQKPMPLRTTMLQVTLLKNINDSIECANEMADLAESVVNAVPGCKLIVNLIPWNDINQNDVTINNVSKQQDEHDDANVPSSSPLHYQRPSHDRVNAFQQRLWQRGIFAQVRTTRGDDATAACGQLATISKTAAAKKAATSSTV